MDEITSIIIGGAIGIGLAVGYKVYRTVTNITEGASNIIKYVNKNISFSNSNEK